MPPVAVVIAARNEADRIAATVTAAHALPGVDVVLVASDGSTDGTVRVAREAGAAVWRTARNQGKAAAMMAGAEAVRGIDRREGRDDPRHLLFLDADLGATAPAAGSLIEAVAAGRAGRGYPRHLLFLDAALGSTAAAAGPLIEPVAAGGADMTIAVFSNRV